MVIILTYMRSGSSFTGDVIQQSPDVFYVYEPLHTLEKLNKSNLNAIFANKFGKKSGKQVMRETIENILTCHLWDIDLYTLTQYHLVNSHSTKPYFECTRQNPGTIETLRCLESLTSRCADAKVTSVKTIRWSMSDAEPLLKKHPQLKIIHLIRDPRGNVRSQVFIGNINRYSLSEEVKRFCDRVLTDLNVSKRLQNIYRGRILTLRYEDLAEKPLEMSRTLYKFLDLEFSADTEKYVHSITQAGLPNGCAICSTRSNSTETALKWRIKSNFSFVRVIDRICGRVEAEMGYLTVTDEKMLRNLSCPLRTEKDYSVF